MDEVVKQSSPPDNWSNDIRRAAARRVQNLLRDGHGRNYWLGDLDNWSKPVYEGGQQSAEVGEIRTGYLPRAATRQNHSSCWRPAASLAY